MKLYFKASEEFITNELKKGNEIDLNQMIEIDFASITKDQRELILRHCVLNSKDKELYAGVFKQLRLDSSFSVTRDRPAILEGISFDEILKSFKNFEIQKQEMLKKEKLDVEENIKSFLNSKAYLRLWSTGIYEDGSGSFDVEHIENQYNLNVDKYGPLSYSLEEIKKGIDRAINLHKKRKEKKEQEKKEKEAVNLALKEVKNEAKEDLKNWSLNYGSELLKLRIKHDQNWVEIAEKEWSLNSLPEFHERDEEFLDNEWDIKDANVEQLKQLENFKEKYKNLDCSFELVRTKFIEESENYYIDYIFAIVNTPYRTKIVHFELN